MARTKSKLKVLHLDDDIFETERVKKALENHAIDCEFEVTSTQRAQDYLEALNQNEKPDIAILDIHIGDSEQSGVELARATRSISKKTVILICSTADDVRTIAGCLGAGVDDFISKNSDKGELSLRVFNSYRLASLKQGGSDKMPIRLKIKPVGPTMVRIAQRIPLIINSAISSVFIHGESGTGKEVVADLFGESLPAGTPFVKVNCGAIAQTLLESELFGYVKGAFTGAITDKKGLLESASGGWIFLDEVATLTPSAQVALLRVLESQELLRVGATKPTKIKLRILSATNEPLETLIKKKKFRGDLWQRLRETQIDLPPLRERMEEIPALVNYFCEHMPGGPYSASQPVVEVLSSCKWKDGNIRELRNCLRAMTEMHVNKLLTPLAIPERIWEEVGPLAETKAPIKSNESSVPENNKKFSLTVEWKPFEQNAEYLRLATVAEAMRSMLKYRRQLTLDELSQAFGLNHQEAKKHMQAILQAGVCQDIELIDILKNLLK
jgi:DNA-binding NtrC family response regulator